MLVLSRYTVVSDPVFEQDTLTTSRLVLSTRSLRTLVVPNWAWHHVEQGRFGLLPNLMTETLREALILVPEVEDELASVLSVSRKSLASSRTLYECIQPTSACQLGCDYCGQFHRPGLLSEEKQNMLTRRVGGRLSTGKYDSLRIEWFGAEPLIGLRVMRTLTNSLRTVASSNHCSYRAQIVTNGLLLSETVARELVNDLDVEKIEVTLDGPAETHDARRHTKKGSPTFSRIFENVTTIARCEDLRVKIVLRCNVDSRNAAQVPDLIELLARAGIQRRVDLYFAPIHNWSNDADSLSLPADEYARLEVDWFALMSLRGFTPPLMPHPKPIVCMAVNPNAELIDPSGEVFNCTEVSLVPSYGDPNVYSLGNLTESKESKAASGIGRFLEDVEDGKYDCSTCPMLPVCGGACPKQWREGRKPCPSAKRNMKERLVLAFALERTRADDNGT
jgi:uncharacterized protein